MVSLPIRKKEIFDTAILVMTLVLALALASPVQAQTFTVIHNFSGGADGATPYAGLTLDRSGNFYGTTPYGGVANGCEGCGVVYKLSRSGTAWILNPLYNFLGPRQNDGSTPTAGVVFGPDGSLYGTTSRGGTDNVGTVFQLRPPANACKTAICGWGETVLYSFTDLPDGKFPSQGNLVFDAAGNAYGTTTYGGGFLLDCDDTSCGTVYEMSHSNGSWSESVICPLGNCSFPGFWPVAGVIFDNAGNLYGTVTNTSGGVFQLMPQGNGVWQSRTLYNFFQQQIQFYPAGGLILDGAGNVYGTTAGGGTGGGGTVFELVRSGDGWNFTVLYNFAYSGSQFLPGPQASLTMDAAGNLYGTAVFDGANGCGMVFKLSPGGGSWNLTTLHDFTCGNDGGEPFSNVVFDAAGNLYGTAGKGGAGNSGVAWEIAP
ncbi:MAG: choice-of-anchor tandem repeat GloVer-containing protein [Candidatus Korobacteraceae bacterium]